MLGFELSPGQIEANGTKALLKSQSFGSENECNQPCFFALPLTLR